MRTRQARRECGTRRGRGKRVVGAEPDADAASASLPGRAGASSLEDIEEVKDDVFDLNEYAEAMDEDLYDVEEALYDDDEFEDYCEFDCPECGETICLDEEDFGKDSVICPSCGKEIFLDDVCDDCECDCEDCRGEEEIEEKE